MQSHRPPDHYNTLTSPARIIRLEKYGILIIHSDPDLVIAGLPALLAQV